MTPKQMLAYTSNMAEALEAVKKKAVFVGLPKEKVGQKVYGDGMTVIRVGAIHEYGGTFQHPGGTRYTIGGDGKARFVSNSFTGPVSGVTKAHSFTIQQRSFLRIPFNKKRSHINEKIAIQYGLMVDGKVSPEVALGRIGIIAENVSRGAFTSLGYGDWKPITAETARRKGSSQTLVNNGILKGAISSVVRNVT